MRMDRLGGVARGEDTARRAPVLTTGRPLPGSAQSSASTKDVCAFANPGVRTSTR
ncbi:hypothetical protein SAMN02745830_06913 [Streptomyces sp. Amel2xC10]|nr:hypothetical protein SAMN02745830_06913 [Streptomyces sp. Amel2xC10]